VKVKISPSLLRAVAAALFSISMSSLAGAQTKVPWTGTWSVAAQQTTIASSINNLAQQTFRQTLHTCVLAASGRSTSATELFNPTTGAMDVNYSADLSKHEVALIAAIAQSLRKE
jgi:hypothetical protein